MLKKMFSISFLLLALSGCVLFEKKEPVPVVGKEEIHMEKKVGVIADALEQNMLNPTSPFVLLTENGEQLPLDALNVNVRRYKKRRVELEGRWNDARTVFIIDSITSLGQETQLKSLYQNDQLGLKFSYPSLWNLKDEQHITGSQKVIITPYEVDDDEQANVDTITIDRSENNRRLSAREWLGLDQEFKPAEMASAANYQQSTIGASKLTAVKKMIGTGEVIEFYVPRDTFIYRFSHRTINDGDKDLYRNVFFDIVQSFEFIPFGKGPARIEPLARGTSTTSLPSPLPSESTSSTNDFLQYIKANIADLAPQAPGAGAWYLMQLEFVFPDDKPEDFRFIYVTYSNGEVREKILLSVPDRTKPSSVERIASFKAGESQDWKIHEGIDTAKSLQRSIVSLENPTQSIVVKAGMTLLNSNSFKVSFHYPTKWYWVFQGGKYQFSSAPVTSSNVLVHFYKNPSKEQVGTSFSNIANIGEYNAMEGSIEGQQVLCVKVKEDNFCTVSEGALQDISSGILASIKSEA